jgi:hypothetical protein
MARIREKITCPICSQRFDRVWGGQIYCCCKCSVEARKRVVKKTKKEREHVECNECGRYFYPCGRSTRFCTELCRSVYEGKKRIETWVKGKPRSLNDKQKSINRNVLDRIIWAGRQHNIKEIDMPLHKGTSKKVIGENIKEMEQSGHSKSQSVAAALNTARKSGAHIPKKKTK